MVKKIELLFVKGWMRFFSNSRKAARNKALSWKLVCCGSRDETFKRFRDAVNSSPGAVNVLLVDAEEPVSQSPRRHLQDRDRWDLSSIGEDTVHLMVQTMEAWIVADSEALKDYYGQGLQGEQTSERRQTLRLCPSLPLNAP